MDAQFWLDRWKNREIGFHKTEVNPILLAVQQQLELRLGQRVLVPLCGKSLDMVWFSQQGLHVTGVELASAACEEFFSENRLKVQKEQEGGFSLYSSDSIHLWCGDFFSFPETQKFDLIYDRAATIALPESLRANYFKKIQSFLETGARLCLIAIEYDQNRLGGPPFSVSEPEIRKAYSRFKINKWSERVVPMDNPRFTEAGVEVTEKIYWISKLGN
ncbi:thiopurine S-methyltransferase [bacterium]|nr:thiopurine S-methyltransferase [bacterium]NBX82748.1 thiopurine S-methyltransferase [bacterium]